MDKKLDAYAHIDHVDDEPQNYVVRVLERIRYYSTDAKGRPQLTKTENGKELFRFDYTSTSDGIKLRQEVEKVMKDRLANQSDLSKQSGG